MDLQKNALYRRTLFASLCLVATLVILIGMLILLSGVGGAVREEFPGNIFVFIISLWFSAYFFTVGYRMTLSLRRIKRFSEIYAGRLFGWFFGVYLLVAVPVLLSALILRPFFSQDVEDAGVAITAAGFLAIFFKFVKWMWDERH